MGESAIKNPIEDVKDLARSIIENVSDERVKDSFFDLIIQLVLEQPLKIPFAAAVVLYANDTTPEVATLALAQAGTKAQALLEQGEWRDFKLVLRFLACLHPLFEDDGVYSMLDELFNQAVDCQAASSEDVLGLELVKIILLTIPYIIAAAGLDSAPKALDLLEKTDLIASTAHALDNFVEVFPLDGEDKPFGFESLIGMLQKQLQAEAESGWALACIPRLYTRATPSEDSTAIATQSRHAFPSLQMPSPVNPGPRVLFPEAYFSLYGKQDIETVPKTINLASSLVRDCLVDTISILDFNRVISAKILIDMDMYWNPGTFVKRATPYDKLKEAGEGQSTWKPEDMALDAVFSQIMKLPNPDHKLVYYHSLITEACRASPAAIAPSLGRAIRFLFRNIHVMDMELSSRFLDWFAHHLSNFEFRWKWTEWIKDIPLPELHPKKVMLRAILDKETRLSFAKRIRETLPKEYHPLIPAGKDKDIPDFKYQSNDTPFAAEGQQLHSLLLKKAPDEEIQQVIDAIDKQAADHGTTEPLVASTDAFVTSICYMGSKSLSHVLSCIARNSERLLSIGQQSEPAHRQILQSVFAYWRDQPGIAVNIIDKLLNYTILTPLSVIQWALGPDRLINEDAAARNAQLADPAVYEMVAATVSKVTNRLHQIRTARLNVLTTAGIDEEQRTMLDSTLVAERAAMRTLLSTVTDYVERIAAAAGTEEGMTDESDAELVQHNWAQRWLRVFRRRAAVEEAVIGDAAVAIAVTLREKEVEKLRAEEMEKKAQREAEEAERANRLAQEKDAREAKAATMDLDMASEAVNGGGDGTGVGEQISGGAASMEVQNGIDAAAAAASAAAVVAGDNAMASLDGIA